MEFYTQLTLFCIKGKFNEGGGLVEIPEVIKVSRNMCFSVGVGIY